MARIPSKSAKVPRSPSRGKAKPKGLVPMTQRDEEMARAPNSRPSEDAVEPMNDKQRDYITSVESNTLTIATGPAGTGKTYLAAALAAQAMIDGTIDRILITRPAVEAGENLGFLPGELEQKYAPYLAPFKRELEKRLGRGAVEMFLKNGRIEPMPLAIMRGHTFDRAFMILDEAQNTSPEQMKMFLSRTGKDTKVIVDGDLRQKDITGVSGLEDALKRFTGMRSVGVVAFNRDDIVRSGFVQDVIERYET